MYTQRHDTFYSLIMDRDRERSARSELAGIGFTDIVAHRFFLRVPLGPLLRSRRTP